MVSDNSSSGSSAALVADAAASLFDLLLNCWREVKEEGEEWRIFEWEACRMATDRGVAVKDEAYWVHRATTEREIAVRLFIVKRVCSVGCFNKLTTKSCFKGVNLEKSGEMDGCYY